MAGRNRPAGLEFDTPGLLDPCIMSCESRAVHMSRLLRAQVLYFKCRCAASAVIIEDFSYNPKSEKVGTVWKTQIKKESSDF